MGPKGERLPSRLFLSGKLRVDNSLICKLQAKHLVLETEENHLTFKFQMSPLNQPKNKMTLSFINSPQHKKIPSFYDEKKLHQTDKSLVIKLIKSQGMKSRSKNGIYIHDWLIKKFILSS